MGHGETPGPAGEVCHVTCYKCTKFHSNPSAPSRGFPGPLSTPAVFPGLFRRGSRKNSLATMASASARLLSAISPRNPSISPLGLGDFPAVFFQWTVRANGAWEKAAIQVPDPSGQELQLHQVSCQSVHSFYRLSLPYLFSPGFPIFFTEHRGTHRPQSPRPFPRSFSHGRHGQTEKGRKRQFSIPTPHVTYSHSTKFQLHPCMQSIGFPILNCFSRALPIFFIDDRGPQRPQSPWPFYLKRSNGHYARTSHGKWLKFDTQTPPDTFYHRAEFHPPPPPGTPFTDGRTDGRTGSRVRD